MVPEVGTRTVADTIAAGWTRYQWYHEHYLNQNEIRNKEVELQYQLVAIGLEVTDQQIKELLNTEMNHLITLLTPLPSFQDNDTLRNHYHFTFVSVAILFDQYYHETGEQIRIEVIGPLLSQVLLPIVQCTTFAFMHPTALKMIKRMLLMVKKSDKDEMGLQLLNRVQEILHEENQTKCSIIAYDSLCQLLALLLQQKMEIPVIVICQDAMKKWRQQPQLIRAVTLHLVPVLVESKNDMVPIKENCVELMQMVVNLWKPCSYDDGTPFHELLYLLCILIPKAPHELIADLKLQKLLSFALGHKDTLVRKQGLHILRIAFLHCALLSEPQRLNTLEGEGFEEWYHTWQTFLTASEVIQMHHEQHLIEQVWPQVAGLLKEYLVVSCCDSKQQIETDQWPVRLNFDWMQSLLIRLFAHDNPVVKRLFISSFMEICVAVWQIWEGHTSACKEVDRDTSFACASAFPRFVLDYMLRACNDPMLFKPTYRARFQALVTDFLVSFLTFQSAATDQVCILDEFVAAMKEAVFGDGSSSHSPDALLSMLQVFQTPRLKRAASTAPSKMLLSETAVDQLRFVLDVYVMQSFSQAMRTKMLDALCHALTSCFVSASTLSLSALARVLCVFTTRSLIADEGKIMLHLLTWMKASTAVCTLSSALGALACAVQAYLRLQATKGNSEKAFPVLSSTQLARLLLFTADITRNSKAHSMDEKVRHQSHVKVVLRVPLSALLPNNLDPEVHSIPQLVLFLAQVEKQAQDLLDCCTSLSLQDFTFMFQREDFYAGQVSCSQIFDLAMNAVRLWLNKVSSATEIKKVECEDHEKEDAMKLVESAAFLLSQISTHKVNTTGERNEMSALDKICDELKQVLAASAANRNIFDLALAANCLSIIGSNTTAVDSLHAFESERMLPLLLALDTSWRYNGKLGAKCAISLAANKWVLLYDVMRSSSFVNTGLLQTTYDACVEALPTAGIDPLALIQMVNVLSLTLQQLASSLVTCVSGIEQVSILLETIWTTYIDSKAKPDALTRAVVTCVFHPVFLLHGKLKRTMKHWIAEFISFGSRHRPNVIFHLACRLCQTWRAHPASALIFADELVELLLYKEPVIDEKEQITTDTSTPFQAFPTSLSASISHAETAAIANHAKDRFVRLIVLSFLADVAIESSAFSTDTQHLMDVLFVRLIELNVTLDWQKQHMLNSDGFGKKLRSWQALCIISAHVTQSQLTTLLPTLKAAFAVPQLPSVRYYMELFGMRMAMKYSREICSGILLPMLCDSNLMPQVGASILLVSAYLAYYKLDENNSDIDCGELLETMLPWLNSSHGYTRVLTQYLLATILPRYVHQLQRSFSDTPGLRFLEGTVRYLSSNKECKRMLRRQARQLEEFHPDYESSLLGMLCSGFINEFGELLPHDKALRFSEQLKTAMNELYAQYQIENFAPARSRITTLSCEAVAANGPYTVQRKNDTMALLLEGSALPTAMQTNFDATRQGGTFNARQRPRQPIIVCASLVDKIPNQAGLARTCEIFNAQKLIVPNLRATEQDVTFATVSATAHKWMPLEEVRPQGHDLRQALLRWKSEGYSIVAVEQTGSSVSLANYMLPRKMVLVLGQEKEGIPVDVLQLVDVCVEIPQFGLVRSLNVHVSGALVLWEYTQQQLISGVLESTLY